MSAQIQRGLRRAPDLDTLYSINPDGSRNMLHPADVHGRWHRLRNVAFAVLIAIYVLVPWIRIEGSPAIRFDIPARTAYLLGNTYTREDFYLVFFLLTGFAFGLFAVTALWGRIWCGYACPQTVFLEGVYRRVERWIEGSRNERLRRNKEGMSFDKLWRKGVKQLAFLAITLLITHTLLAYFLPVEELLPALLDGPEEHWLAFSWTIALTAVLYFDFAWFREQFCVIMCPYGRLQSALIDDETVVVGYDKARGEPRGPKTHAQAEAAATARGDCIDCRSCVHVCPTGIDIRNGLQMECIGCTNCMDACDSIMQQVGRPTGLVRYDSLRGFRGQQKRFFRPRLFLYAALALVGLTVFATTASQRTALEVTVLRARGLPYTLQEQRVQNLYTLHLQNKSAQPTRYQLIPEPSTPAVEWTMGSKELELAALGEAKVSIFAHLAQSAYTSPFPLFVRVVDPASGDEQRIELKFQGP
jgi:cytochrome c oxidase accessory protein FixG